MYLALDCESALQAGLSGAELLLSAGLPHTSASAVAQGTALLISAAPQAGLGWPQWGRFFSAVCAPASPSRLAWASPRSFCHILWPTQAKSLAQTQGTGRWTPPLARRNSQVTLQRAWISRGANCGHFHHLPLTMTLLAPAMMQQHLKL